MALPRSGAAVRAARFRGGLQADRARAALVPDPAAVDDDHIHVYLRAGGAIAHRRPAAVPLLYVRHSHLDLLRGLHHQDLQHLRQQRPAVRKGLLSAPGGAGLDPDLEPDHIWHPVWALPGLHGLLRPPRIGLSPQLVDAALAGAGLHDGRSGSGIRDHHLIADHQIPRSALPGAVRGAAVDVRHAGHLPGLRHPCPLPADPAAQPDDADRGGLPLCLPGGRRFQLRVETNFINTLYGLCVAENLYQSAAFINLNCC